MLHLNMLQIQENGISELNVDAAQWGHIALPNAYVWGGRGVEKPPKQGYVGYVIHGCSYKWRENNASATRRIDDDGKVLKKIPLSLVQVGAYILRTVDRVSY